MKRHISNLIFILLLGCTIFTACIDDDYTELNKGNDTLTLTSSETEIVLDEEEYSSDALELSWSTGTNNGTGNRIYYTLELAQAGTDFSDSYCAVKDVTQEYSWTQTVEELNTILLDNFGLSGGESVLLEARVTAIVANQEEQTATTQFTVTAYEPLTSTLYLIGDATPNGWSTDNAAEMTRTENGVFTWTGTLTVGSFKFITTLGSFLPSYNKGTDGNLVFRTSDDESDELFTIDETNEYQVDVNLFTGKLTLSMFDGETPAYDQIYFVGDMTDWEFVEMKRDVLDSFLFRYGQLFDTAGEFKFGTSYGSWENMYKATYENAPYTETSVEFVSGYSPDYKWYIQSDETDKAYKICLDIRSGNERMLMREFTPYEMIYLIGDASPAGWTIGDATSMTSTDDPYIFTWTGNLSTGELKFTCDKQDDWNGAWFMPVIGGQEPTGESEDMLFIDKSDADFKTQYIDVSVADIDQKWNITTAGTYTITLNQLNETISIVKQ